MKYTPLYACMLLSILPVLGADVDFSTQRLPIEVPDDSSEWAATGKIGLQMTPMAGNFLQFAEGYNWIKKHFSKNKDTANEPKNDWIAVYEWLKKSSSRDNKNVLIGHVLCPKTLVAENIDHKLGGFAIRHLAVQYALEPEVNGMERFSKKLKAFRVGFVIRAANGSSIQIADVIPNTAFINSCISGKIGVNTKLGIGASGRFGLAEGNASITAQSAFSWNYQPKDLVVASSFVGSSATVDFGEKTDGTVHVGQVPVEMSLLVPADLQEAELLIITTAIDNNNAQVPAGSAMVRVLFQ